jgi:hypothetical protein
MYPINDYVQTVYNDRLREADNARLVRAIQKDEQEPVVQLRRRRGWLRTLFGRRALAR